MQKEVVHNEPIDEQMTEQSIKLDSSKNLTSSVPSKFKPVDAQQLADKLSNIDLHPM